VGGRENLYTALVGRSEGKKQGLERYNIRVGFHAMG
jgi:hypothetical protein